MYFNTISCWKENYLISWNISIEQRHKGTFIFITEETKTLKKTFNQNKKRLYSSIRILPEGQRGQHSSLSDTQLDDKSAYSHRRLWPKISVKDRAKVFILVKLGWHVVTVNKWERRGEERRGEERRGEERRGEERRGLDTKTTKYLFFHQSICSWKNEQNKKKNKYLWVKKCCHRQRCQKCLLW